MKKIKIIILGGGFGGVYTAKRLSKLFKNNAEITLINKNNYFIFTPLLHEVATGSLNHKSITESLPEIFRNTDVNFIEDTVSEIDKENKLIKLSNNSLNNNSLNYDYLVISTGAETNYFGINGAKENTYALKNIDDALNLKMRIISAFEQAESTKNKDLLSFAVVGAGATGIELATELYEYTHHILHSYYKNSIFTADDIKISIITTTAEIIPQFPTKMRSIALEALRKMGIEVKFNTIVKEVQPNILTFNNGETLKANTIVWVAGVKSSLSNIKGIEADPKGRLEINEYLQSTKNTEIFGLGDASGNYPMLAQIAVEQANTVARNIYLITNNKSTELIKYSTKIKGLLLSLGHWSAIGNFGKITLHGAFMWWLWRTIYLFNFNSWKKRFEIMIEWTINIFYPRDIINLK